jgi:hypothetical protein
MRRGQRGVTLVELSGLAWAPSLDPPTGLKSSRPLTC